MGMLLALMLAAGAMVYGFDRAQISGVRMRLDNEVDAYYTQAGSRAAWQCLEKSRPFLEAETTGRYVQRLRSLDAPDPVIGIRIAKDWYGAVLMDLQIELDRWARTQLNTRRDLRGNPDNNYRALISETPCDKIMSCSRITQSLIGLSYRLLNDDSIRTRADIENCRREFEALRSEMEVLLKR